MAESIVVEQDEDLYWTLGSQLMQIMIAELNDALKSGGVTDAKARQKICSPFSFGLGNFIDQYWMEIDGQKYYPLICFSKQFLDVSQSPKTIEPLQLPSKDFEFHGAAGDVAVDFFGKQAEELEGVRIGYIGEDGFTDSDDESPSTT